MNLYDCTLNGQGYSMKLELIRKLEKSSKILPKLLRIYTIIILKEG